VGVRPRTVRQTYTHRHTDTHTRVTTIQFASSTTHALCNKTRGLVVRPTDNLGDKSLRVMSQNVKHGVFHRCDPGSSVYSRTRNSIRLFMTLRIYIFELARRPPSLISDVSRCGNFDESAIPSTFADQCSYVIIRLYQESTRRVLYKGATTGGGGSGLPPPKKMDGQPQLF